MVLIILVRTAVAYIEYVYIYICETILRGGRSGSIGRAFDVRDNYMSSLYAILQAATDFNTPVRDCVRSFL